MGLGIKARATARHSRWKNHLQLSKDFFYSHIGSTSAGGTMLIIGAGRFYDFPVDLCNQFDSVTIVDADPIAIWINRFRFFGAKKTKFFCQCADISTWRSTNDKKFDVVISLNLLGQIPLYHRDRMRDGFLATAEGANQYLAIRKKLQLHHLQLVKDLGSKVLVTFDREFYSYDPMIAPWEEELALDSDVQSVVLPYIKSTWLWHIADSPEGAIHRIGAAILE